MRFRSSRFLLSDEAAVRERILQSDGIGTAECHPITDWPSKSDFRTGVAGMSEVMYRELTF